MKVCYFFSNYHQAHFTGQPAIILKLAQKISNKEEVFIISNADKKKKFVKKNIHFFLFKANADIRGYIMNFPRIVKYLYQIRPDVLHVHKPLLFIFIWFINLFFGLPMVCSLCETLDANNLIVQKLLIFCLKRTEKTFVSAKYIKGQLIKMGVESNKVEVARIGVDQKAGIKSSKTFNDILFFGDSKKERGFDFVFKLAKMLDDLRFKILIRWEGKDGVSLLKKMKKLKNTTVLFYPYSKSLEKIVLQSKIIVLPFRWLAMRPPLSVIESMALGKCVVTSKMRGNEEVIKNGKNGFMVNFNNLDQATAIIKSLVKNNKERKKIGSLAKKTIENLYSYDEYKKIHNFYLSLLI